MTRPLVIAHRGASHDAPENTLAAFRLAWEQGADAIETDLRLSADGMPVCIHDADGRRTLGDRRVVRDILWSDLATRDAGSWKASHWSSARVCSLPEILAESPADRRLFLELKEGGELPAACARAVRASSVSLDAITFIAFEEAVVTAVKRLLPKCRALWLSKNYRSGAAGGASLSAKVREMGIDGVDLEFGSRLDADLVKELQSRHFSTVTYTVNDAASIRRCAALGLDGLTTDRPADALRWLADISA